jgi:hypothetical protein
MNALLSAPHRRDVIIGDDGSEWLVRLFAAEVDGAIRDVRVTIASVVYRDETRRPVFTAAHLAVDPTYDPASAFVIAQLSVRHDGITTVQMAATVGDKRTLWGLLAALEQGRREAALEMGSSYLDRFEYGKEKRRG